MTWSIKKNTLKSDVCYTNQIFLGSDNSVSAVCLTEAFLYLLIRYIKYVYIRIYAQPKVKYHLVYLGDDSEIRNRNALPVNCCLNKCIKTTLACNL